MAFGPSEDEPGEAEQPNEPGRRQQPSTRSMLGVEPGRAEARGERERNTQPLMSMASGPSSNATPAILEQTISEFRNHPSGVPKLHEVAQRKYTIFCRNRTADLYMKFFELVDDVPDFSEAEFVPNFTACVPMAGQNNARPVCGMAKAGICHGVVRYEYHNCIVEECRKDGREHGLRVVCTQMGDIWIRLWSEGKRLAQIVLTSDFKMSMKPIDEGGLRILRSNLHLILECFEATLSKRTSMGAV